MKRIECSPSDRLIADCLNRLTTHGLIPPHYLSQATDYQIDELALRFPQIITDPDLTYYQYEIRKIGTLFGIPTLSEFSGPSRQEIINQINNLFPNIKK